MRRYSFHRPGKINDALIAGAPFLHATHSRRRNRAKHGSYVTPSRDSLGLLSKSATQMDWIEKYEDHITYHATWRANIYFLLLIFYYKQRRIIQIASTPMQYGKGIEHYTQACHSSIFPGLSDHKCHDTQIMMLQTCLFRRSFLWHWNSMTVGCPMLVNEFDTFLEGRGAGSIYRKNLLIALNQCSFGVCDPVEGMRLFYWVMLIAFKDQPIFLKRCEPWERKSARRVIALQKRGMFHHATRDCQLKKAFVKSILEWDGSDRSFDQACLKTQKLLLRGNERDGEKFLKRFDF